MLRTGWSPGVQPNLSTSSQILSHLPLKNLQPPGCLQSSSPLVNSMSCSVLSGHLTPTINGGNNTLAMRQSLPLLTSNIMMTSVEELDTSSKRKIHECSSLMGLTKSKSSMGAKSMQEAYAGKDVGVSWVNKGLFTLDNGMQPLVYTLPRQVETKIEQLANLFEMDSSSLDQDQWKRILNTLDFIRMIPRCKQCQGIISRSESLRDTGLCDCVFCEECGPLVYFEFVEKN